MTWVVGGSAILETNLIQTCWQLLTFLKHTSLLTAWNIPHPNAWNGVQGVLFSHISTQYYYAKPCVVWVRQQQLTHLQTNSQNKNVSTISGTPHTHTIHTILPVLFWNINRTSHVISAKIDQSAKITTQHICTTPHNHAGSTLQNELSVHEPCPQQIAGGHLFSGQRAEGSTKTLFV